MQMKPALTRDDSLRAYRDEVKAHLIAVQEGKGALVDVRSPDEFSGKVTLSDITPPERYRIAFEGQGGVAGFGKGESTVTLEPAPGGSELTYTVKSTVGGKIAQLGQRLIDGAAKSMADDFFRRFEEELLRRHPEAAAARAAAAPVPAVVAGPSGPWPGWAWPALAFAITFVIGLIVFFTAAWR